MTYVADEPAISGACDTVIDVDHHRAGRSALGRTGRRRLIPDHCAGDDAHLTPPQISALCGISLECDW